MIMSKTEKNTSKYTFKFEDGHSFTLEGYQSPRGIRHEDKRPNLIVIDCHIEADQLQLIKHIEYLTTLVHAMEWQKED